MGLVLIDHEKIDFFVKTQIIILLSQKSYINTFKCENVISFDDHGSFGLFETELRAGLILKQMAKT
jgi:hypothetical protein